jgi:hypothetical protein
MALAGLQSRTGQTTLLVGELWGRGCFLAFCNLSMAKPALVMESSPHTQGHPDLPAVLLPPLSGPSASPPTLKDACCDIGPLRMAPVF